MATTTAMTGAAFDQLPYEEGRQWELLEGELIPVPSTTARHQRSVIILGSSFEVYLKLRTLGVVLADNEFALGDSVRLRPDLAVLLTERWAKVDWDKTPIPLAPDIAVEVLSPSEYIEDNLSKVWTYLGAGAQEVWEISLRTQKVMVYRRGRKSVDVLELGDHLSTPLLPDWGIAVADLFER